MMYLVQRIRRKHSLDTTFQNGSWRHQAIIYLLLENDEL
uniref:Uncharacterized protein n=1 Tax=Parascaris equorum TaxID=6256 RepID=A0A914R873_PAREQ